MSCAFDVAKENLETGVGYRGDEGETCSEHKRRHFQSEETKGNLLQLSPGFSSFMWKIPRDCEEPSEGKKKKTEVKEDLTTQFKH